VVIRDRFAFIIPGVSRSIEFGDECVAILASVRIAIIAKGLREIPVWRSRERLRRRTKSSS
jgi:hypothetical protein